MPINDTNLQNELNKIKTDVGGGDKRNKIKMSDEQKHRFLKTVKREQEINANKEMKGQRSDSVIDTIIDQEIKAQNEPIVNLACSGGGAKGAMYSGFYEVLVTTNLIKELEQVSGSSAGSLIASMIAFGVNPIVLKTELESRNLLSFGKPSNIAVAINTILNSAITILTLGVNKLFNFKTDFPIYFFGKPIFHSNSPLKDFIEKTIKTSLKSYCFSKNDKFKKKLNEYLYTSKDKPRSEVEKQIEDISIKCTSNSGANITFKDLELLRKIDPEKFKTLHITATKVGNGVEKGKLDIFNAVNTPEVSIALAASASSAFPVAYQKVKINDVEYSDGGILDNIPTQCFQSKGRTMMCAFIDDKNKENQEIIHSNPKAQIASGNDVKTSLTNLFINSFFAKNSDQTHSQANAATLEELRRNPLNVLILNSGDIKVLDLREAHERYNEVHERGFNLTLNHLAQHEHLYRIAHKEAQALEIIQQVEIIQQDVNSSKSAQAEHNNSNLKPNGGKKQNNNGKTPYS